MPACYGFKNPRMITRSKTCRLNLGSPILVALLFALSFRLHAQFTYVTNNGSIVASASAGEAPQEAQTKADTLPHWKATTGWYHFSNDANAWDFNLRYSWKDMANFWVGYYLPEAHDPGQWRGGWDSQFTLGMVRIMPSLQLASRDFVGGSFGVETGEKWFVGVGYGLTNLKPYVNLNFDPNDSYTVNAGYRWDDGAAASVLWVQDIRQNPDQKHLHFIYRTPLPKNRRLTFDVLFKTGLVENSTIYGVGASVTYDWRRYFMRLAYDPHANFAAENMWRLSVGVRF